jgi:hypothetical protein
LPPLRSSAGTAGARWRGAEFSHGDFPETAVPFAGLMAAIEVITAEFTAAA